MSQEPNSQLRWKTKDGRFLRPIDMESSHLVNCLYMILRAERHQLYLDSCSAIEYAGSAPDGAAMAAEQAARDMRDLAYDVPRLLEATLKRNPIAAEMNRVLKQRRFHEPKRWPIK